MRSNFGVFPALAKALQRISGHSDLVLCRIMITNQDLTMVKIDICLNPAMDSAFAPTSSVARFHVSSGASVAGGGLGFRMMFASIHL